MGQEKGIHVYLIHLADALLLSTEVGAKTSRAIYKQTHGSGIRRAKDQRINIMRREHDRRSRRRGAEAEEEENDNTRD
eukprot:8354597-Heterocapsa_arctica.AAC.1